jgi:hypothetical protein
MDDMKAIPVFSPLLDVDPSGHICFDCSFCFRVPIVALVVWSREPRSKVKVKDTKIPVDCCFLPIMVQTLVSLKSTLPDKRTNGTSIHN